MSSDMGIRELSDIIEAAIRGKAAPFLAEGRAKLEVVELGDSPLISLEPMRGGAAPLEVSIDTEYLVTCFPGRCGMSYEVFSKDSREIEGYVCGLTKAVIAGGYSERVNDAGAKTKIVARWQEGGKVAAPRINVIRIPRRNAKDWRTVKYLPY
jgi:hypothetical protein